MATKLILYLDVITTLPDGVNSATDLSQIYQTARKQHDDLGLQGLISFERGAYLHVFEGEEENVHQFFQNDYARSKENSRSIIIDATVVNSHFPGYTLKIDSDIKRNSYFLEILQSFKNEFKAVDATVVEKLKLFFDFDEIIAIPTGHKQTANESGIQPSIAKQVTEPVTQTVIQPAASADAQNHASIYAGKLLMITGWPDFTRIQQSFIVIEMCSRLLRKKNSYQELSDGLNNNEQREMNQLLQHLDQVGLLEKFSETQLEIEPKATLESPKPTSFYKKMKSFLKISS